MKVPRQVGSARRSVKCVGKECGGVRGGGAQRQRQVRQRVVLVLQ